MAKTGSGNKGSANDTGKSGNVKEARGPSYEERYGKHPPNKQYTGPKDMHPQKEQSGTRQSDKA